jgi:hypothetical protein
VLVFWPAQFLQDDISRVPDWEGGIKFETFRIANEKRNMLGLHLQHRLQARVVVRR